MNKLKVVGDPNNTKSCSSEIIISNLNQGLKNIGLYDDNGIIVVYDCLAQHHGFHTNHIICAYETSLPSLVMHNAGGRNLIGVSFQNQSFFLNGGYPKEKTDFTLLGVNSNLWKPKLKPHRNKFVFGMMCDSNTRAAYTELITAFGEAFSKCIEIELYIKDRWATETFKKTVKNIADSYQIIVHHDDNHITNKEEEIEIYNNLDCHIFLNRTSTFALTVAQGMAMQLPTIVMDYSGPRDYCNELNSCLVDYSLLDITPLRIMQLEQQGYRNYLITRPDLFQTRPQWAQPYIESIKKSLIKIYEDKEYRETIAYNARAAAEVLTWERAANNLAYIVNKL